MAISVYQLWRDAACLGVDSCDGATVWVSHLDMQVYLCTCWRKQPAPPAEVGRMPPQVGTSVSSDERGGHGIRPWLSRPKEFKRLRLRGHWSRSWIGSFPWGRRSHSPRGRSCSTFLSDFRVKWQDQNTVLHLWNWGSSPLSNVLVVAAMSKSIPLRWLLGNICPGQRFGPARLTGQCLSKDERKVSLNPGSFSVFK